MPAVLARQPLCADFVASPKLPGADFLLQKSDRHCRSMWLYHVTEVAASLSSGDEVPIFTEIACTAKRNFDRVQKDTQPNLPQGDSYRNKSRASLGGAAGFAG
jgi:hypothetical protein